MFHSDSHLETGLAGRIVTSQNDDIWARSSLQICYIRLTCQLLLLRPYKTVDSLSVQLSDQLYVPNGKLNTHTVTLRLTLRNMNA